MDLGPSLKATVVAFVCHKIRENYCLLHLCHFSLIVVSLYHIPSFRYMTVYNEKKGGKYMEREEDMLVMYRC